MPAASSAVSRAPQAQVHLRLAEFRPTRGDPEIACERNLETAAEAVPIDRGDRRLGKIRQMADDLLGPTGEAPHLEGLRDVAERREVGSGAERAVPGSRDDDAAHAIVIPECGERLVELLEDFWTERVESIRSVDRDRRHVSRRVVGDEQGLVRHCAASRAMVVESLPRFHPEVPAGHHVLEDLRRLRVLVSLQRSDHAVARGPFGNAVPRRIASSISEGLATSRATSSAASLIIGARIRIGSKAWPIAGVSFGRPSL